MAAGTINTVVGSGTLITFPVLLAFGYAPVTANVTNTLGLVSGQVTGTYGYREELRGQWRRTGRLACASVAGGVLGAFLLLQLPASAFKAIVPVFIGIALLLVVVQPRLSAWLEARGTAPTHHAGWAVLLCVFATGVYGGYFGAAQGILLLAVLGIGLPETLHRINAVKNVLAGLVNLVAAIVFVFVAHIAWDAAALIALGALCGGIVGARVGRRLPPPVLRGVIVVVGVSAILQLLLR
ncbi:MAG: uncharacterized protein QOJ57_2991 [Thermoleophilaceae bacterium]|jgi:uncharacterized membrane protein YfcA|nr:uncharacterized protein [Thermoleophilaceae bacterium]